jgi:hypothetical protein
MHARNEAKRASEVKPFYRGKKVTVIGAITLQEVVALMTIDNSMDSQAFEVFIEKCLVPRLWSGAVVVMDNLPAHKLASIKPMIEAVGASILCLSPTLLILIRLNYGGLSLNLCCDSFHQPLLKWLTL